MSHHLHPNEMKQKCNFVISKFIAYTIIIVTTLIYRGEISYIFEIQQTFSKH